MSIRNFFALFFSLTPEAFARKAERLKETVSASEYATDDFSNVGYIYKLELSTPSCRRRFKIEDTIRTGDLNYDRKQCMDASVAVLKRARDLGIEFTT